jgi:hypothetical protein
MKSIDKALDKILCQACINTYKGHHGEVKEVLTNSKFVDNGEVEFIIGELDNRLVVAFQGSDGTHDWIHDINFVKTKVSHGEVHTGFYKQFEGVKKRLIEEILKYNKKELIFTGHSLGASLAILASYFLNDIPELRERYIFPICVLFGSPRMGTSDFTKEFLDRVLYCNNYINAADMVCKVPTVWMFFRHVERVIKIGQKLSWREKLLYVPRWVFGNPLDHEPERYLKNLG